MSNHPIHEDHAATPFGLTVSLLAWLGVIITIIIVLAIAYSVTRPDPVDQRIIQERVERLAEVQAKQTELTTTYGWVNQQDGIVRIPVSRAMQLIVADPEIVSRRASGGDTAANNADKPAETTETPES
jgi:hypothetical protein